MISGNTKVNLIIGHPVRHSLTPALHNSAYKLMQKNDEFIMVAAEVPEGSLKACFDGVRALGINGLSVTAPHKEAVLPFLDRLDDDTRAIGAVNTIKNDNGTLVGFNTDWQGITNSIETRCPLKSANILVLGAGGASRAAIFGLRRCGANVSIMNRTTDKAHQLAQNFGGHALPYDPSLSLDPFDVVINCTSVGLGDSDCSPLPLARFRTHQVVFETIYHPRRTKFLRDAESAGADVIPGISMFFHQALVQIEIHTGAVPDKGGLWAEFEKIVG